MAQVIKVIKDALSHLRVIAQEDEPEPYQVAASITVLNNMMTRLEADGLALGWQNVSQPDATIPIPPEAVEGIAAMLAIRLRPKYGVSLEPDLVAFALSSEGKLRADYLVNSMLLTDSPDLPAGQGQPSIYGWRAGYVG